MKENSSSAVKNHFLNLHEKSQVLGGVKEEYIEKKGEKMEWNVSMEIYWKRLFSSWDIDKKNSI